MASYKFTDQEAFSTDIPENTYCFEVVDVETGMVTSGKTYGSETVELKLLFRDAPDGKKVGQFTETLILHQSCYWKVDTFVKAANLLVGGKPPRKDQDLELSKETLLGLRGWASVHRQKDKNDATKSYIHVKDWICDRDKVARVMPAPRADQEEEVTFE